MAYHDLEHGYGTRYELMTVATPVDNALPCIPSIDGVILARIPADPAGTLELGSPKAVELLEVLRLTGQYESDARLES